MSKKAMKLACKALRDCHYYMINAGLPNQSLLNEAFTAYMELEAALAKQPAQQKPVNLRRGDLLRCIETDELCTVWATSTTGKTLIKWSANNFGDYTAEQIGELFWLEPAQQEPVAWQYRDANDDGTWSAWLGCDKRLVEDEYRQVRALFTSPQPAPVQQEPVAVVSGYYGGQCVILPTDPARIYNSNTPLYTAPQPCPTCEALARTVMLDQTSHDAQRKPLTITEESAWDLASYVYARSNPHESPQILLSAMEIKQIIEAAHGIKENT